MSQPVPKVEVREFVLADEVAKADAMSGELPQRDYGYEFSNGRRFDDAKGAYAQ